MKIIKLLLLLPFLSWGQVDIDQLIDANFKEILLEHKAFVSLPNLPSNPDLMLKNIDWVQKKYDALGYNTSRLTSETLPILLAEKIIDPNYKTILFYFHIDGQPVDPSKWDQEGPFTPVLKKQNSKGDWETIEWSSIEQNIDDEWRIYGRAAADDKAPIMMFITALELLKKQGREPSFNIKVIFDPEEEYSSTALLSTLTRYKSHYDSDYFIVMDGPAHTSNKPTLTFGCRGIATCSITTYGPKLPQHSGHYGNYAPNPVFKLADLLSSMKDKNGRVLIEDYYKGIAISEHTNDLLEAVPFNKSEFDQALFVAEADAVGDTYQEALQYPSLNVRQIGTSWSGDGLKTVIPSYAVAHLDVRLVPEISGEEQLNKIKNHLVNQGYHFTDQEPTDAERLEYPNIVKFIASPKVNAFRTDPNATFGKKLRATLTEAYNESPISIRLMGGTVPIVPVIKALDVPTVIIPMVNMDNNQHNPNENIRIGNLRQGIKTCLALFEMQL